MHVRNLNSRRSSPKSGLAVPYSLHDLYILTQSKEGYVIRSIRFLVDVDVRDSRARKYITRYIPTNHVATAGRRSDTPDRWKHRNEWSVTDDSRSMRANTDNIDNSIDTRPVQRPVFSLGGTDARVTECVPMRTSLPDRTPSERLRAIEIRLRLRREKQTR